MLGDEKHGFAVESKDPQVFVVQDSQHMVQKGSSNLCFLQLAKLLRKHFPGIGTTTQTYTVIHSRIEFMFPLFDHTLI